MKRINTTPPETQVFPAALDFNAAPRQTAHVTTDFQFSAEQLRAMTEQVQAANAAEQAAAAPAEVFSFAVQEDGQFNDGNGPFLASPPHVPLEAFPPEIQRLLIESAHAFTVPQSVPAATLIALLSCMVGRTRALQVKNSWREYGNMWVVIVAPSGLGKTPVAHAFFKPVERLENLYFQEWKKQLEAFRGDIVAYESAKKKGLTPPLPQKPNRTQFYLDDATLEGVADALSQNFAGITWRVDEVSGLISSFDRYSAGKSGGTRARLLSSYDCQAWKTSRRDAEKNLFIPKACVSIFGGIQPRMLRKTFDESDGDSGFLPRFAFVIANRERAPLWNESSLSAASHELLETIVANLSRFRNTNCPPDAAVIEFAEPTLLTTDAKALFVQWHDALAIEGWANSYGDDLAASIRQKLKAHALRLCLLLHCLDAALANGDALNPVPADTMRRALLLADWIKANQLQVLELLKSDKVRHVQPLERAIMSAIIDESAAIEANGWKIANSRLVELVNSRMSMPVKAEQIGKAASGLELKSCLVGEKRLRGRIVSPEKIELFKATVSNVSPVSKP